MTITESHQTAYYMSSPARELTKLPERVIFDPKPFMSKLDDLETETSMALDKLEIVRQLLETLYDPNIAKEEIGYYCLDIANKSGYIQQQDEFVVMCNKIHQLGHLLLRFVQEFGLFAENRFKYKYIKVGKAHMLVRDDVYVREISDEFKRSPL